MQIYFMQLHSCVACTQTRPRSRGVVVLTWCYQSQWCEKASPVLPRSACRQRRKPGTHPETAYHHLQETHTQTHTPQCEIISSRKHPHNMT